MDWQNKYVLSFMEINLKQEQNNIMELTKKIVSNLNERFEKREMKERIELDDVRKIITLPDDTTINITFNEELVLFMKQQEFSGGIANKNVGVAITISRSAYKLRFKNGAISDEEKIYDSFNYHTIDDVFNFLLVETS